MSDTWQNLAIISVVAVAAGYLVFRFAGWLRYRRACAECRLLNLAAGKENRRKSESPSN